MHTITACPRCGKDFMYHHTDVHLFVEPIKNIEIKNKYPLQDPEWPSRRWNEQATEYCDLSGGHDVVCHECYEIENIAGYIKEKAEHRGWENAECMATDKFGEEKTLKAIQWLQDVQTPPPYECARRSSLWPQPKRNYEVHGLFNGVPKVGVRQNSAKHLGTRFRGHMIDEFKMAATITSEEELNDFMEFIKEIRPCMMNITNQTPNNNGQTNTKESK